jgi:hypothetical protein
MKYFAALGIALLVIAAASVGPWAPSPFTSQTGTNTTAAAWRTALGAAASSTLSGYVTNHTGAATNLALTGGSVTTQTNADLTASRVVVTDASKVLASSSVTSTTLGYLDATSSVQTQLDSKPNLALLNASQTFTGSTNTFKKVKVSSISTSDTGLEVYGGSSFGTANANSGEIKLGNGATDYGLITYNNANGVLYIDNHYSSGSVVFSVAGNSLFSALSTGTRATAPSTGTYGLSLTGGSTLEPSSGSAELRLGVNSTDYGSVTYGASSGDVTLQTSYAPGKIRFRVGTNNIANITSGGVVFGATGTAVADYWSQTATLNFGSILAAGYEDLTITVTGAAVNDTVTLGLPATVLAGAIFNAWVSAADTVTVRCNNAGSIAIDPASATYRVGVTSH